LGVPEGISNGSHLKLKILPIFHRALCFLEKVDEFCIWVGWKKWDEADIVLIVKGYIKTKSIIIISFKIYLVW
jgi:hypothetical protein